MMMWLKITFSPHRSLRRSQFSYQQVNDWDATNPTEGAGIMAASGQKAIRTFFERITKDIEIVRVALLLTGCIQVRERWGGGGRGQIEGKG